MSDQPDIFKSLKEEVLFAYQKHYPYFNGQWTEFSSKDIQQLIDLIENNQKERISEKWIYTHLKPETNEKLPRKDMLDILSRFTGYSGWDEFVFKQNEKKKAVAVSAKSFQKKKTGLYVLGGISIGLMLFVFIMLNRTEKSPQSIEIKNEHTDENIPKDEIKVYEIREEGKIPLKIENNRIEIEPKDKNPVKLIIESPYYETKEIEVKSEPKEQEIYVKPDDYALVLKAFMKSDIKDWETRKEQLDKILSENLEVIVHLKNDLGAEYLNKTEFSQKLIIPTETTKKMKLIELKSDENKQITFIRIKLN